MGISGARPGYRRLVAGIALGRGRNVRGGFGLGVDCNEGSIMATGAVSASDWSGGTAVVHGSRCKSAGIVVASVALGRGRNVVGRFAKGRGAVVTGRAAARDCRRGSGMIEGAGRPAYCRIVTAIALRRGRNMGRRLHLRILGNKGTAMAVRA